MASCQVCLIPIWIATFIQSAAAKVSVLSRDEQMKRLIAERKLCEIKNAEDPYTLSGLFCNRTWDNIVCWPDTPAGELARQPCPQYINMFDQGEYVTRRCTENGTWWVNPVTNQTWSNYSACIKPSKEEVPQLIQEHMPGVKLMYTIGYSLSLTTLILALIIMIYFKRLHCPRNMIHMNMFLAFGMRAAFSLMKNVLLVNDLGFANDVNQTGTTIKFVDGGTHWECKLFFTLFYYIIFASVMWLFNEGLYLQLILSVAVFADKTKVRWFVLLGWGFPLLFVFPWVICRIFLDDMLCWNVHVYRALYWILHGPMVASVAINFVIFVNIVRMLFTKLRAVNCPESKMVRYRKLAKSTLILIPLFAVYYMIFIWLPDNISPTADLFKLYVEMLFNSFQGFLVALLFCFLNHEVQYEIRKKWQRRILRKTGSRRTTVSHHSLFHRSSTHRGDNHSHDQGGKGDKRHGAIKQRNLLSSISEENCSAPVLAQKRTSLVNGTVTQSTYVKTETKADDVMQPLVFKNNNQPPTCLQSVADINRIDSPEEPLVICNETYPGLYGSADTSDPLLVEKSSNATCVQPNLYSDPSVCAILPINDISQVSDPAIIDGDSISTGQRTQNGTKRAESGTKRAVNKDSVGNGYLSSKDRNSLLSDVDDDRIDS